MTRMAQVDDIVGMEIYDSEHNKIGKVDDLYADATTEKPTWLTVSTGMFGTEESFVPLEIVHREDDSLYVDTTRDAIKDAPRIEHDKELSPQDEAMLYQYYQAVVGAERAAEQENNNESKDDNKDSHSDAEQHADKDKQEAGRVRLKKYVIIEKRTIVMPVSDNQNEKDRS